MKTRIAMLIIGIAIGAYIGGFMSSETITYYNYTETVASFGSYQEVFEGGNVSSARIIAPAVDEEGNGVATALEVRIVPGNRRALVDIDKLIFWTDTQNSIRVSRSVAENTTGIDLSYFDIMYSIEANASVIEGPSAGAALTMATIAALRGEELGTNVMITGTINHDSTIGPVGQVLAKAIAAKAIGAEIFLVPLGQSQQVVYENIENCQDTLGGRNCNVERIPTTISVQKESGIRIIEVKTIQDAMAYFFSD